MPIAAGALGKNVRERLAPLNAGCTQKYKVIKNGLTWISLPNDKCQEEGSRAKRSRVFCTSVVYQGGFVTCFFGKVYTYFNVKIARFKVRKSHFSQGISNRFS